MNPKPTERNATPSGKLLWSLGFTSAIAFLLFRIDLLALFAALLLGTAFASRLFAKHALAGLHASLSTNAPRARANAPFPATLSLRNDNRFLPVFYPTLDVVEEHSTRIQKIVYRGILLPQASVTLPVSPEFEHRGERRLTLLRARSLFPFSLYIAEKEYETPTAPVIVWPALVSLDPARFIKDRPHPTSFETGHKKLLFEQANAERIREYRTGDPRRAINWKLTAKMDKPIVLEARATQAERYVLALSTSKDLWPTERIFEQMITLVASLAHELMERRSLHALIVDATPYPMQTPTQVLALLDTLALAKPTPPPNLSDLPPYPNFHSLQILPHPKTTIEARPLLTQQT